jgi:hypothetical protein
MELEIKGGRGREEVRQIRLSAGIKAFAQPRLG